jgi:hypothetical protein
VFDPHRPYQPNPLKQNPLTRVPFVVYPSCTLPIHRDTSAKPELSGSPTQLNCQPRYRPYNENTMSRRSKLKRNEPCPCLSGEKFKNCCSGKIDWETIVQKGLDYRPFLSVRGRNLQFVDRIAEALQFASATSCMVYIYSTSESTMQEKCVMNRRGSAEARFYLLSAGR